MSVPLVLAVSALVIGFTVPVFWLSRTWSKPGFSLFGDAVVAVIFLICCLIGGITITRCVSRSPATAVQATQPYEPDVPAAPDRPYAPQTPEFAQRH